MSVLDIDGVHIYFHRNGKVSTIMLENNLEYSWDDTGRKSSICFIDRDDIGFHGELKCWHKDGSIRYHTYEVNDREIHDFLLNPLSDEERMLLVLKYGAPLFPKEVV